MTPEYFVDALKEHCRDAAVCDVLTNLRRPPGRRPSEDLLAVSRWFNGLSESDRASVAAAMQMAADATLFGVLCVIDGATAIENGPVRSDFELASMKAGVKTILSPSDTFLHDILRAAP